MATLPLVEAQARRATGLRVYWATKQEPPEHELPTLNLRDAKPLRCLRGCGQPAWLDTTSIWQTYGRKALWICKSGHDGMVKLVGSQ